MRYPGRAYNRRLSDETKQRYREDAMTNPAVRSQIWSRDRHSRGLGRRGDRQFGRGDRFDRGRRRPGRRRRAAGPGGPRGPGGAAVPSVRCRGRARAARAHCRRHHTRTGSIGATRRRGCSSGCGARSAPHPALAPPNRMTAPSSTAQPGAGLARACAARRCRAGHGQSLRRDDSGDAAAVPAGLAGAGEARRPGVDDRFGPVGGPVLFGGVCTGRLVFSRSCGWPVRFWPRSRR